MKSWNEKCDREESKNVNWEKVNRKRHGEVRGEGVCWILEDKK